MGINPLSLPDALLLKMDSHARKALGKSGLTREEEIRTYQRGEELQEQKIFRSWLNLHDLPFISPKHSKKSTIGVGKPDFHIFKDNRFVAIEMKARGQKPEPDQETQIALYWRNGCDVHVCFTAAEAIDLVRTKLAL